MYIANAGTSRYIKVRMNICTGGTAKCKHLRGIFALVATARRSLGLLPLQRLHALQVAGHEGTAVLRRGE